MKKIIATITIFAAAFSASYAQSMSALLIPSDAESMSMAASTVALEPSAKLDAEAFWGKWAPGAADNMMAGLDLWASLGDKFALTVDGTCFRDQTYDITSSGGRVTGSFTPREVFFGLGGNLKATDYLSIELKAGIFASTIGENLKGNAFGADLVMRYHGQGFNVAAGTRNLGTPIKYGNNSKTSYAMPAFATVGGSYSNSGFTATGEVDYLFSGALMAGLGLEYCIRDVAFVRAGCHYGDPEKALPSFASLGLGARFSGVKLNLAYILANRNIGGSLLLGLGYAF